MQINYKYQIGQKVSTPEGKTGEVLFVGSYLYENHYWVKTGAVMDWHYEEDLKPNPTIWHSIKSVFSF